MRILQVCSVTRFGGGERHLADLCRVLVERGHDVYAASIPGSPIRTELSFLANARMMALSRRSYPRNLVSLASLIRKHDIEIIHAHAARDYHLASLAARLAARG